MAIIVDSESSNSASKNLPSRRSSPAPNYLPKEDTTPTTLISNFSNSHNHELGPLPGTASHQQASGIMSLNSNDPSLTGGVLIGKSANDKGRGDPTEQNRAGPKIAKESPFSKEEMKSEHLRNKPNLNFSISNILNKESNLMHSLRDNILSGKFWLWRTIRQLS